MAGESPDKSEQRKSSGETASGEHDPRLAMLGRSASSPPAPAVDQPTAVFAFPPEVRPGARSQERPGPGAAPRPGARRVPGTDTGSVEGDAKLRSAVAAWVASAEDSPAAASAEETTAAPTPPAITAEVTAVTAVIPDLSSAGAPEKPQEAAEGPSGGDGTAEGSQGATEGGTGSEGATGDATEAPVRSEPEAESSSGPGSGTDSRAEPGTESGSGASDPTGSVAAASAASAGTGAGAAAGGTEPDADGEAGTGGEPRGDGDDTSGTDADAHADADAKAKAGADAEAAADSPADASAKAPDKAPEAAKSETPASAAASDTSREGSGAAAVDGDRDGDEHPASESVDPESTGDAPRPGSDANANTANSDADTDAGDSADAEDAAEEKKSPKAVDNPTAVFKALKQPSGEPDVPDAPAEPAEPSAPALDSPTTALKLPPAPSPGAESVPAGRASTFVPLREERAVRTGAPDAGTPSRTAAGGAEPAGAAGHPEAERTSQQPVPPLPPLDLLAELTNTPDTPVRTVMRRIKIWTPLVLLLGIIFAVVQILRPLPAPELTLSAEPVFTFKGGKFSLPFPAEGQGAVQVEGVGTIGTYGAQKPAPIASIAKTMTAYVILRDHPLTGKQEGEKITVDAKAEKESKAEGESVASMEEGQEFTQKQMLQLLMIPSGNNAARLLARWDAGTEAAFAEKMNQAAKDLGMTDSVYTDPSGFEKTTVSTPADQLKLAQAVMKNPVLRDITNTTLTEVPGSGSIRNNNDRALLQPGVDGIKTGSTTPAGGNLLWSTQKPVGDKIYRINGIVMGVQDAPQLELKLEKAIDYSIEIITAARAGLVTDTVVKKGDVLGYVDNGLGGRASVVSTKDLTAVGWAGLRIDLDLNDGGKNVPGSGKAGDVVGQVSIGTGPGRVSAPVALQEELTEPGVADKLTRVG
ncbi:serine hydrolase [Streptomyces sp. NPDC004726]